ncbi:MAG: phosphate ABC transporter permease subunit PstC, partial [Candidatus Kapaibacterium sp.]
MDTPQAVRVTPSGSPAPSEIRALIAKAKSGLGDGVFFALCALSAVLIVLVIAGLIGELISSSQLSINKFGSGFLTSKTWDPVMEEYGASTFIYGTVVSSLLGLLLALPLSLGIAVFLV